MNICSNGRTIRICADENLDWRIFKIFDRAAAQASCGKIKSIEVDFQKTRIIRDSGLNMLLMLVKLSGLSSNQIVLVNCRPEIQERLYETRFSGRFHVAQETY